MQRPAQRLLRLLFALGVAIAAATSAAAADSGASTACPPVVAPGAAGAVRAPPRDRGVLWQIRRGGHVSHLYGTLHVGKPDWATPGPALRQALDDSDVLALELDVDDPRTAAAVAAVPPPPRRLPAKLQQRLRRAIARACLSQAALAGLHPMLQAATLDVLDARWLGLDARFSQESALAALARPRGMPVVALETAAQQLRLLAPADPAVTQAALDQSLTQLEAGSGRRVMQRLADAWEDGDLDALADFQQWCECAATASDRAFLHALNDDRNAPMADRIAALHAQGQRVLVAVGALHMTGAQALPLLLAQRGFAVRRVRFAR